MFWISFSERWQSTLFQIFLPDWFFQLYISSWKSPSVLIWSIVVDWDQNTNELTNHKSFALLLCVYPVGQTWWPVFGLFAWNTTCDVLIGWSRNKWTKVDYPSSLPKGLIVSDGAVTQATYCFVVWAFFAFAKNWEKFACFLGHSDACWRWYSWSVQWLKH